MRRPRTLAAAFLASVVLSGVRADAAPPSDIVIVVDESSPIRHISVGDVRRRFLGIPLVVDGTDITPVRNLSNADFYEAFLQRVLFMSAPNYERRMLNRVFREGGARIVAVDSMDELRRVLHADPSCISFLPRSAVGANLRIVAEP